MYGEIFLILITVLGLGRIALDSYHRIRAGRYSLDYIAFVAMALSLYAGAYLAGAVIAVMFIGGKALERFASARAEKALKRLIDTIPKTCLVEREGTLTETPIQDVAEHTTILVKRNEMVPLDGVILSPEEGVFNLANLTGEVGSVELKKGTFVKSGALNSGETLRLRVVGNFSSSAYQRIVGLVEYAKAHPAGTVQLSEKANIYFTLLTIVIAATAYLLSNDIAILLAVLVIATPCPLIIAAPVAFISGMSRAAREGIILRKPAALEDIARADAIFFDKTGTLTLGEPVLAGDDIPDDILAIAAGLELHSLHPLARTIVGEAKKRKLPFTIAEDVHEEIGKGISGMIAGKRYAFSGISLCEDGTEIARFHFDDVLKEGASALISRLKREGVHTAIITGDRRSNAEKLFGDADVEICAEQSPEDKYRRIEAEQEKGRTILMVGDGLNDAPALAKANVGIVFSGTENGASIEAADIAILGGGLEKLDTVFTLSHRTVRIARQSIYGGIGLSLVGMVCAAFGYIPPVTGAFLQEAIDVAVILNALRALTK